MICKIVRLGKLMCQNYMRSIEKIKSKKSFYFTFDIDIDMSKILITLLSNHTTTLDMRLLKIFPGEQVSGSLEVSTLKKLFSSLNLRAIKKYVKRKFM